MERKTPSPAASRVPSFAFVPLYELEERHYRILLVDDDPDSLSLLKRTLAKASEFEPELVLASSAKEAKKALKEKPFDMVIADQVMPEENGIELLIEVRDEHPETLRLLITAYPSLGTVLRAVNLAQVHSYIEKPFDPKLLNRTIYESLLRRQERDRTQLINAHDVREALDLLQDFERTLPQGPPRAPERSTHSSVTFTFHSPVDFNRFVFEMIQAKSSPIKDVHVFEGRYHVTVAVQPTVGGEAESPTSA